MTGRRGLLTRLREGTRSDAGMVAVWVAILMPLLFGFAAFAVDVSRWYVETERLQKAADAAALAGVVYMPADFTRAKSTALSVAAANGYANGGRTVVTVTPGDKPSRLRVAISTTIDNVFGAVPVVSQPTKTLGRSAVADFAGPVPMGSPCPYFGNQPDAYPGAPSYCSFTPNLWANVAGPDSPKANGDRFTTRQCASGNSYCNGTNVDYYGGTYTDPFTGLPAQVPAQPYYFYKITVTKPVSSIDVQLFDPAFVDVGDHCEKNLGPAANTWAGGNAPNPYVTDATTRYAYGDRTNRPDRSAQPYCTGDYSFDGTTTPATSVAVTAKVLTNNVAQLATSGAHGFAAGQTVIVSGVDATFNGTYTILAVPSTTTFTYARVAANVKNTAVTPNGTAVLATLTLQPAVTTSVAVHAPTDTLDPLRAPVLSTCVKQYPGFKGVDLTRALNASDPYYRQSPAGFAADQPYIAQYFRRWSSVCTILNPQIGDYYLQVRTNVVPGSATATRMASPAEDPAATGTGHNRFSMRVLTSDPTSVATAALERMPIYANLQGGTTQFYIARVGTASAGATLTIDFFDTGDASDVGSISIVRPTDATGDAIVNCRAVGEVVGNRTTPTVLPTCTLSNVQSGNGYNGKLQRLEVPIPDNYACQDSALSGCWFRVNFTYAASALVQDTTTWSASLDGDPVRLIQ